MVVVVVAAVAVVMAAVVVVVAALLLTANISETSHTRWQNGENSQRRISAFQFNQIAGVVDDHRALSAGGHRI